MRLRVRSSPAPTGLPAERPPSLALPFSLSICLALVCLLLALSGGAQEPTGGVQVDPGGSGGSVLPPLAQRPRARVNIREFTSLLSDDIGAASNKTNCVRRIERFYEKDSDFQELDPSKLRDNILEQINNLLSQHKAAVIAIASEAELLAAAHKFSRELRVNYTDVHRLRNELEVDTNNSNNNNNNNQLTNNDGSAASAGSLGSSSGAQQSQFTSIGGGTPVAGPAEWQTPIKSIVMQMNKNFGDIPVNTSMSAVHIPLPIYAGQPEIQNGIAWTERLDQVFKRNLAKYAHVHHQYYGDTLGFLRTFPAHRWRIPRTDPDLFDARTRPWYSKGASSPKDVVILIDSSGSMTGLRREIAKGIVFELLDTLTNNDYFSVMRFSDTLVPIGIPKCNLRSPPLPGPQMSDQCAKPADQRERFECAAFRRQWENRGQYLRDHPDVVLGKNASYLSDEAYWESMKNVTNELRDAYLLPATSRNIRYLKSNFSMPTAGIANFSHALMGAFELLQSYNRTGDLGTQCNQAIMLITDGVAISHADIFNRYNYPNSPVRVFTYMIGREVGDITQTKAMACDNRGYYTHVINLGEVREQVQKYLPVMARPMVLAKQNPISWTYAYGDETHQVLTDWVLEVKRRERARIMLTEERDRLSEANSSDVINIELTNIPEYDELPQVDEQLKNRIICEDNSGDDPIAIDQSLSEEIDPLGYNELGCHWASRRADLLTSVVRPVYDTRNTSLMFERVLHKNVWSEREIHVRNAQLLGVAAVDLRIADIVRTAPSFQFGPNGYVTIIGPNGFVLHHPDLRALLEDPFDKQSKILKPHFSAVDFSHIELVYHKNESDANKKREDDMKLLKLRESALRRLQGSESLFVKRAVDCRRRLHIRQQLFYYGPIKDTPFSLLIALPRNYGLNRLSAKLDLDRDSPSYFKLSAYDLWTVHPEYKYCELGSRRPQSGKQSPGAPDESAVSTILEVLSLVGTESAREVVYEDLTAISNYHRKSDRITCDKELFRSLLFDAAATHESPSSFCGTQGDIDNCPDRPSSSYFYGGQAKGEECVRTADEMRSNLMGVYGLEMSFLATRSGLTRVKVFDLSARIKKLAELFIQRHNRAVDESWYARTVDWNMRFSEDATILTVPYNAYARLVAKLRQRITERHPAANETRANCDLSYDSADSESQPANSTDSTDSSPPPVSVASSASAALADTNGPPMAELEPQNGSSAAPMQNDDPSVSESTVTEQPESLAPLVDINYNEYSSFDFLDLLANSSVHISATQSVIANKGAKQRTPVSVTGMLYDYATFARRFLNSTSLNIRITEQPVTVDPNEGLLANGLPPAPVKVDLCPSGACPTKCGYRNDTIDCLLLDNNAFIVVGEELPYIGRPLNDYDENLMQSLVERRVYHQVTITDYQAICSRNDQADTKPTSAVVGAQTSSSAFASSTINPFRWEIARALLANLAASFSWLWSTVYLMFLYQTSVTDSADLFLGHHMHMQRSVVDAQSAVANQSLLALLPNKTYLRPCEKTITLYETRPVDFNKLSTDQPEYYVSKCGCSGWYVYEAVPKTNLIMLIVNTTSACRRCEPVAPLVPINNFVPVVSPVDAPSGVSVAVPPPNKTAEDQVCAMIERDAQLYTKRPDTCLAYHPDEAQIHLCGAATKSASISNILLAVMMVVLAVLTRKGIV